MVNFFRRHRKSTLRGHAGTGTCVLGTYYRGLNHASSWRYLKSVMATGRVGWYLIFVDRLSHDLPPLLKPYLLLHLMGRS